MDWHRIRTLIRKEILALVRDPQSRFALIVPPLLQLVIFAFATTLEVKDNTLTILNEDGGKHAAELVQRFTSMDAFSSIRYAHNQREMDADIDQQRSLAAVHFPEDFSESVNPGQASAPVQIIVDGRRSNSGQIATGYLSEVIQSYGTEQLANTLPAQASVAAASRLVVHHWFNPNRHYLWFTVPGLAMLLTTIMTMIVTALSVARERELGTFEQVLVSPLSPGQILLGKALPAYLTSMLEALVIIGIGIFLYGVPFRGSLLLLLASLSAYITALVGVGLFISSICKTQQQAILGVFSFMLPAVLLSGYASPIDNMPGWLQNVTEINPLMHAFNIFKGIFLKAMGPATVWENTWPLLLIAAFTLSAANWMFRHRLE